jgi:hypothetical protein
MYTIVYIVAIKTCTGHIYSVSYTTQLDNLDMRNVKEVIEKKNNLVMQMAFSTDVNEVRMLMKQVRILEGEIKAITLN